MNRLGWALLVLLGIQIVVAVAVFRPNSTTDKQARELSLLADVETIPAVYEILINDSPENQTRLLRRGKLWILPELGNLPVDEKKIQTLRDHIVEQDERQIASCVCFMMLILGGLRAYR